MCSANAVQFSLLRLAITTLAPHLENARAISLPIPRLPPVIVTTFPDKSVSAVLWVHTSFPMVGSAHLVEVEKYQGGEAPLNLLRIQLE